MTSFSAADRLAFDTLAWAFGSKPQSKITCGQQREIRNTVRQSRLENQESPLRARLRFMGLAPHWARGQK